MVGEPYPGAGDDRLKALVDGRPLVRVHLAVPLVDEERVGDDDARILCLRPLHFDVPELEPIGQLGVGVGMEGIGPPLPALATLAEDLEVAEFDVRDIEPEDLHPAEADVQLQVHDDAFYPLGRLYDPEGLLGRKPIDFGYGRPGATPWPYRR